MVRRFSQQRCCLPNHAKPTPSTPPYKCARAEKFSTRNFRQLEKGKGDTELLIFGHEVVLGQSGAPVISTESQSIVGLVEGQWFGRNSLAMVAAERQQVGANPLPIHYAIALLQQKHIAWQTSPNSQENHYDYTEHGNDISIPEALSLVPARLTHCNPFSVVKSSSTRGSSPPEFSQTSRRFTGRRRMSKKPWWRFALGLFSPRIMAIRHWHPESESYSILFRVSPVR